MKCGDWYNTKSFVEFGVDWIISEMKVSGLCGCGGVGFLSGLKWLFMLRVSDGWLNYFVVNVDESESGTCKDREIMRYDSYKLLEGCLIVGMVMWVCVVYIYICGEYVNEWLVLEWVLVECYVVGYLGKNACGSGMDFDVNIYYGVGVYICGEEMVLIEFLEGK